MAVAGVPNTLPCRGVACSLTGLGEWARCHPQMGLRKPAGGRGAGGLLGSLFALSPGRSSRGLAADGRADVDEVRDATHALAWGRAR